MFILDQLRVNGRVSDNMAGRYETMYLELTHV